MSCSWTVQVFRRSEEAPVVHGDSQAKAGAKYFLYEETYDREREEDIPRLVHRRQLEGHWKVVADLVPPFVSDMLGAVLRVISDELCARECWTTEFDRVFVVALTS